jgi:hypothetical protein
MEWIRLPFFPPCAPERLTKNQKKPVGMGIDDVLSGG